MLYGWPQNMLFIKGTIPGWANVLPTEFMFEIFFSGVSEPKIATSISRRTKKLQIFFFVCGTKTKIAAAIASKCKVAEQNKRKRVFDRQWKMRIKCFSNVGWKSEKIFNQFRKVQNFQKQKIYFDHFEKFLQNFASQYQVCYADLICSHPNPASSRKIDEESAANSAEFYEEETDEYDENTNDEVELEFWLNQKRF